MGIRRLHTNSDTTYTTSKKITSPLARQILKQSNILPNEEAVKDARSKTMCKEVRDDQQKHIDAVKAQQTQGLKCQFQKIRKSGSFVEKLHENKRIKGLRAF